MAKSNESMMIYIYISYLKLFINSSCDTSSERIIIPVSDTLIEARCKILFTSHFVLTADIWIWPRFFCADIAEAPKLPTDGLLIVTGK